MKSQRTVRELADWWLATAMRPPFASRYIAQHRATILRNYVLPYIGNVRVDRVDSKVVARWQRELFDRRPALAQATIKTAMQTVFASMWSAARRERMVEGSPTAELRWPRRVRELPDCFSLQEVERICAWFRSRCPDYALYVELLAWTGARPSEISGLRVGDYDPATGRLSIARGLVRGETTGCKTARSQRTIVLATRLRGMLERESIPSDPAAPLCRGPGGAIVCGNRLTARWWGRALEGIGVRYRKLYCLRHSYISAALTAGAPAQAVADYCGTSPTMLQQHYARWMRAHEGDPLSLACQGAREQAPHGSHIH